MCNIIDFSIYKRGMYKMGVFDDLIKALEDRQARHIEYTCNDADDYAEKILEKCEGYFRDGATPIVKIVKNFGIKTYKESLEPNLSGDIYVNGDTKEKYKDDKVIVVNKKEELYHQRFVIAHELAHYLFEFVGNEKYRNPKIKFSNTYYRDKHYSSEEQIANRFAASILMPKDLFIKQYNIAQNADSNRLFIVQYLSQYFETTIDSIERRIKEVLK